ncbi:MAG: DUF6134 family protein [Oceanipulchritudo sp.]
MKTHFQHFPVPFLLLLGVTGLPATLCAEEIPAASPLEWEFRVFLDDKEIGTHDFLLDANGQEVVLRTEAAFDVKFLFFTAYTYRHRNVEKWDEKGLVSIDAYTDANGQIHDISGERRDEHFVLYSRMEEEKLPRTLMTFAYWNPDILREERLLNSQSGEYEPVRVVERGVSGIEYNGQRIDARRFDLVLEETTISIWYDVKDWRWVALESPTESGRVLRYEPARLPQASVDQSLAKLLD